jgi:hypothetical protein
LPLAGAKTSRDYSGTLFAGKPRRSPAAVAQRTAGIALRTFARSLLAVDPVRLIMLVGLTLFLAEGFTLSVFPTQFKEFLMEAEPRFLQAAGLAETIIAAGLMAGILLT